MLSQLIEALQIALKYGDIRNPTHCEHDKLALCLDPAKVSEEDKKKLASLGFHENKDGEGGDFYSYRFGSF